MTELPPPAANYVRKPNPVTGFIDKVIRWARQHKGWSIAALIATVLALGALGSISGGAKAKANDPAPQLTVCEAVAEFPKATRGDLIDLALKSNPSMSRRQAQDAVSASPCAPR